MPTLLEINVDTLFEQHSVSEIDLIHKKLQNDVEHKKEELRTMVGERYRDLLKAADTIGNMRNTACTVTTQVEGIIGCCQNLNEHQLIGFKTERAPINRVAEKATNNFYGIIEQINLLTQLPELIWTAIDTEDYFVATQLFIFSRHINTGLNLDHNKSIMKSFPVAVKLWNVLSSFYLTIKQACLTALEREHLTTTVAAKCLASIVLLENCPLEKLLTSFIKLRTKAFKQTLLETNMQHQRVKEKLLASVRILIDTIVLLYNCLIDNGNGVGQLMAELNQLSSADSHYTINLMKSIDDRLMTQLLPDIIAKFRPNVNVTPLSDDTLKSIMQSWLQFTNKDAEQQLKSLIDVIASIKTIHYVKSESIAIIKPNNWQEMLQKLYLPTNLDLYQFYYQPLINQRIQNIIKNSLKQNIDETYDLIVGNLSGQQKAAYDVKSLFWTEDPDDIPLSLKQALSNDRQSHKLCLKTRGYTPIIVQICNQLDGNMNTLFSELKLYLSHHDVDKSEEDVGNEIAAYLRSSSLECILELITKIKSIDFKHTQSTLIFIATLLHAITELCPNLQLCLQHDVSIGQQMISSTSSAATVRSEQWDNVRRLLDEESLQFWTQWIDLFIRDHLITDNHLCFNVNASLTTIMKEFCNWDCIKIEEKDDADQPIQSVIRIPSQPSISLQQFLFRICQQLHKIIPHTLPKNVTTALVDRIATELCHTYNLLTKNEFICHNQSAALQYFFDIRFVALMLCARENKRISDQLQQISAALKAQIDPFDFELFHKYVMANVKKCGYRMQHKLGSIVPNVDLLSTLLGQQTATMLHEKDPNVLALSTVNSELPSGWFPMLPVVIGLSIENEKVVSGAVSVASLDNGSTSKPNKTKKSTVQHSALPSSAISTQNVRAGAAAFFGAMSQEWFR